MKHLFLYSTLLLSVFGWAQPNLKYSGFFDSYYTTGPVRYFGEAGLTMMHGELENGSISGGIGGGVNYRILPPVYLEGSLRYLSLRSTDHDASRQSSFTGNKLQLSIVGHYHFVYDVMRTSADRRRGPKKWNAYALLGMSFNLMYKVNPTAGNAADYSTIVYGNESGSILNLMSNRPQALHFPIGLGLPIRVTPRVTIVPEISTYLTAIVPFIQNGSDRIDGLEYVGDNKNANDVYSFVSVKFMFNPKGKRLKPKKVQATNGSGSGGGGSESDSFDEDFDDFDNFDSGDDEGDNFSNPEEEINEEEPVEELPQENSEDNWDDTPKEDDGPKYDEDGFLIDE